MSHPLIAQLRFTRSEFQRGLQNITDEIALLIDSTLYQLTLK